MKSCLEIGICGDSLFMSQIEKRLQRMEGLHVRRLGDSLEEVTMDVKMLSPNAVIYQLQEEQQTATYQLQQDYLGVKMIGLRLKGDFTAVCFADRQENRLLEKVMQVLIT